MKIPIPLSIPIPPEVESKFQFIKGTSEAFIGYKQVTSFTNRQSLSNV